MCDICLIGNYCVRWNNTSRARSSFFFMQCLFRLWVLCVVCESFCFWFCFDGVYRRALSAFRVQCSPRYIHIVYTHTINIVRIVRMFFISLLLSVNFLCAILFFRFSPSDVWSTFVFLLPIDFRALDFHDRMTAFNALNIQKNHKKQNIKTGSHYTRIDTSSLNRSYVFNVEIQTANELNLMDPNFFLLYTDHIQTKTRWTRAFFQTESNKRIFPKNNIIIWNQFTTYTIWLCVSVCMN